MSGFFTKTLSCHGTELTFLRKKIRTNKPNDGTPTSEEGRRIASVFEENFGVFLNSHKWNIYFKFLLRNIPKLFFSFPPTSAPHSVVAFFQLQKKKKKKRS